MPDLHGAAAQVSIGWNRQATTDGRARFGPPFTDRSEVAGMPNVRDMSAVRIEAMRSDGDTLQRQLLTAAGAGDRAGTETWPTA